MKTRHPQPVAFCWYLGKEMSRKDIQRKHCEDPAKQLAGLCKHLQFYSSHKDDVRRLTMQDLYEQIYKTLEQHGMRIDGSSLCLVQELPSGGRLRLWFDEAERIREGGDRVEPAKNSVSQAICPFGSGDPA